MAHSIGWSPCAGWPVSRMPEPGPVLLTEQRGAVRLLTMNRPHALNAFNAELERVLSAAFDAAEADPGTRAVVLCGAGRAFSAGADLKERADDGPVDIDAVIEEFRQHSIFLKVIAMDTPVVAAVHGYCLGGAMQLAGVCHLTILGTSARLGEPEVRFANPLLVPITPHLVGAKQARRLLYLGSMIDADEALALGLANEVVPDEHLLDRALAVARELAAIPTGSISVISRSTRVAASHRGLEREAVANAEILTLTLRAQALQPEGAGFLDVVRRQGAGRAVADIPRTASISAQEPTGVVMTAPPTSGTEPALVRLEHRGNASIVAFDQPKALNAMNRQLLAEFDAAFELAVAEPTTRTVIIRGEGRAFSAGMDLKEPDLLPLPSDGQRTHLAGLLARAMRIWRADKPVIAAVQGHCLGHACDLAAAADVTVAAASAQFGVPEVRHLGGVAAMLYPYLMSQKAARDFLYRGESLDAEAAVRLGLATKVVGDEELLDAALALSDDLAAIPLEGLRQMKRAINRVYDGMGLESTLAINLESLALVLNAQPAAELAAREDQIRTSGLRGFLHERDGSAASGPGGSTA